MLCGSSVTHNSYRRVSDKVPRDGTRGAQPILGEAAGAQARVTHPGRQRWVQRTDGRHELLWEWPQVTKW